MTDKKRKMIQSQLIRMIEKVELDDEHLYKRKSDGKYLAGVTSILDVIINKPFLMAWSTKENYLYLKEHWDINKQYTEEEKEQLLLEAKVAYKNKSEQAKEKGTDGHKWLENYVKAKIRKTDLPSIPKDIERPIKAFLEWEKENSPKWIASEARVFSPSHEYAGTLDALAEINGKLVLIDFKFANQISLEYYLQTAAYQNALEEFGIYPDRRLIIRLPKTEKLNKWNSRTHKSEKIDNLLEARYVPTDYKFDREVFLHAREIYKWYNSLK